MTANVITYRGRSAAREAGKVLGFDQESIDRLSKLVPVWGWRDASDTPEKQFREAGLDLSDVRVRKFHDLVVDYKTCRVIWAAFGRHGDLPGQLDSVVPWNPRRCRGRVVCSGTKKIAPIWHCQSGSAGIGNDGGAGRIGRFDSRSLWREIDLGNLPQDDPQCTRHCSAPTPSDYFRWKAARRWRRCRACAGEILRPVVQVAIIRPGPIVGKMAHPYLMRRQGKERPDPLHPLLKPVLERTLGVPLFQEQLLRMAMIAADFTGGEAEELRRHLGSSDPKNACTLSRGSCARDDTQRHRGRDAGRIVQSITSFAMYGFPESHAASFALLAYASAYLARILWPRSRARC